MSRHLSWNEFLNSDLSGWENTTMGSLFSHRQEKNREDLTLLSVTGSGGVVERDSLKRRDTSNADKSKYLRVEKGDVVYNTMRMWQGVSGSAHIEGIVSPAYTVLRPLAKIDSGYAKFLVKQELLIQKFHQNSQGLVDDTLNLKFANLIPIIVKLPPLPEQKKIASILTSVDEVIENTQKQIDKLQDLKKATMNELLTKGIGHTEFKDSELGRIPKSWEVVPLNTHLEDMTDFVANGSFASLKENVFVYDKPNFSLYVRLYDLRLGLGHQSQKYIDKVSFDFLRKSNLKENDILIANIGANVGEVFLMPRTSMPASIAPNMILMRCNPRTSPIFLYYFLKSELGSKSVSLAISGSGQPKMNKTDLKRIDTILPPFEEQVEIESAISSLDNYLKIASKKLGNLSCLKKSLMQDLLTGKKRVQVN